MITSTKIYLRINVLFKKKKYDYKSIYYILFNNEINYI